MLDDFRGRQFYGTAELADVATSILRQIGSRVERGTVSDYPDERTVRYYLAEGLLPAPDDKSGLKSVFGFRHLLTLLVIKHLQSEHLPIRKIREIIDGRGERELERLLGPEFGEPGGETNEAKRFLEGLLVERHALRMESRPPSPSQSHRRSPQRSQWQRYEILPGLEINFAAHFRLPPGPDILEEVVDEIRRLLISRH